MEEIGLNLKSQAFIPIGKLDEREITSTVDGKLMMILVPYGTHIQLLDGNGQEEADHLYSLSASDS